MKRRQTRNKDRILNIFRNNHLLSVPDICNKLGIEKSVVYRNVKRFVEDGTLKQVQGSRGVQYEMNEDNHQHFICVKCGKISCVDIDVKKMKSALPKGAQALAFDISVRGLCHQCAQFGD